MKSRGRSKDSSGSAEVCCATCGAALQKWPLGRPVFHCEGSKKAFNCYVKEPHHVTALHANCWKCGGGMGCPICSGPSLTELLCRCCAVWTTEAAFLKPHGPISNDEVSVAQRGFLAPDWFEYPKPWRMKYQLASDKTDDELRAEFERAIRRLVLRLGKWPRKGKAVPAKAQMVAKDPEAV